MSGDREMDRLRALRDEVASCVTPDLAAELKERWDSEVEGVAQPGSPLADGVYPASLGYFPDPTRLSPNAAKRLLPPSTPKKFDEWRKNPPEVKKAWDFGKVAHKLVLNEGDQFLVLDPDIHGLKADGTSAAQPTSTASWKQAETRARAEGLTPIHVDDYRKALAMAEVVHQHPTAGPLLSQGVAEQWLYWTDEESGQKLRQRIDWMHQRDGRLTIVEYKTAAEADPDRWPRRAFKLGYFLAYAFAVMGAKTLGLAKDPDYVFIAQEKEPPYDLVVYEPDIEASAVARRQMRQVIATYQQCMKTQEWPGYPMGRVPLSPPPWEIDEMEF